MLCPDLILIGFGNVARRFARLLDERAAELRRDHGLDPRIVAIATSRHGVARDTSGLDLTRALELVERGGSLAPLDAAPAGDAGSPGRVTAIDVIHQAASAARAS